ncbi:MAG: PEGA domain-containing protein [Pseudomonadota bacterium]
MKKLTLLFALFGLCLSVQAGDGALAVTTVPAEAEIYVDGELKVNMTPIVIKLPAGKHHIEIKAAGKETQTFDLLITEEVLISKEIRLVNSVPFFTGERINFSQKRDSFETEAEFQQRLKQLSENSEQLVARFNQAVQQHDPLYQAGVAYLDKAGYDVNSRVFPVRIEWQAWAKELGLPEKSSIFVGRYNAKALWEEGQHKPVYVYLETEGDKINVSRQVLIGLDQKWALYNPSLLPTRLYASLQGHSKAVLDIKFSPNGSLLASVSLDETVKLWNVNTALLLHTFSVKGHGEHNSVAFSPDGGTLVSGAEGNTIKFWDVNTGQQVRTLKGENIFSAQLAFNSEGRILASSSNQVPGNITLWDVKRGQEILTMPRKHRSVSIAFNKDGDGLASQDTDENGKEFFNLWDTKTGEISRSFAIEEMDWVDVIALMQEHYGLNIWRRYVLLGNRQVLAVLIDKDESIVLWDINSNDANTLQTGEVSATAFSPNGNILASGGMDGSLKLWKP